MALLGKNCQPRDEKCDTGENHEPEIVCQLGKSKQYKHFRKIHRVAKAAERAGGDQPIRCSIRADIGAGPNERQQRPGSQQYASHAKSVADDARRGIADAWPGQGLKPAQQPGAAQRGDEQYRRPGNRIRTIDRVGGHSRFGILALLRAAAVM